jgi:hypothetical protein
MRQKRASGRQSKSKKSRSSSHLRLEKTPRRVPVPMVGQVKNSFFGLVQPKSEGHSVLSQLFD